MAFPYTCAKCQAGFHSANLHEEHMRSSHPQQAQYTCRVCSQKFNSKADFNTHLDMMNHRDTPTSFKCRVCSQSFSTQQVFNNHLKVSGHRHVNKQQQKQQKQRENPAPTPSRSPTRSPQTSSSKSTCPPPMNISMAELRRDYMVTLLKAYRESSRYTRQPGDLYIFGDFDNLMFPVMQTPELMAPFLPKNADCTVGSCAIKVKKLSKLITRGQNPKKMVAVYHNMDNEDIVEGFGLNGWTMQKSTYSSDHHLQLLMSETGLDENRNDHKKTMVLLTGDGNTTAEGHSFIKLCEKFLARRSWSIEIYSWAHNMSEKYLLLMKQYPGRVMVSYFDDSAEGLLCSTMDFKVQLKVDRIKASFNA